MKIHIVKRGETLAKIAKKYNISLDKLKEINSHLKEEDKVIAGSKVKIPTSTIPLKPKEVEIVQVSSRKEVPIGGTAPQQISPTTPATPFVQSPATSTSPIPVPEEEFHYPTPSAKTGMLYPEIAPGIPTGMATGTPGMVSSIPPTAGAQGMAPTMFPGMMPGTSQGMPGMYPPVPPTAGAQGMAPTMLPGMMPGMNQGMPGMYPPVPPTTGVQGMAPTMLPGMMPGTNQGMPGMYPPVPPTAGVQGMAPTAIPSKEVSSGVPPMGTTGMPVGKQPGMVSPTMHYPEMPFPTLGAEFTHPRPTCKTCTPEATQYPFAPQAISPGMEAFGIGPGQLGGTMMGQYPFASMHGMPLYPEHEMHDEEGAHFFTHPHYPTPYHEQLYYSQSALGEDCHQNYMPPSFPGVVSPYSMENPQMYPSMHPYMHPSMYPMQQELEYEDESCSSSSSSKVHHKKRR
ncbi:MAG TPA: LysM peptidoglycan-binding domain-containing protein [Bacillota bacterium]|nr:LysM peptidoglycan-binding domain-containing protein [Bacillota bacterium]